VSLDGFLNLDKPLGMTSFGLVAQIRGICRERRVGHAGTLDPMATGVLPICLGRATKLVEYLQDAPKTYIAEVQLGQATDSYDATGRITYIGDHTRVTPGLLEEALGALQGSIDQKPPPYSAVKANGKPLYRLARAGAPVEPKVRRVQVYRLRILDWQPPRLRLEIDCGKGTYIRSLAHDLGIRLGCGAYLHSLVRTRYGPFHLAQALTLAQVAEAFQNNRGASILQPPGTALSHWPAVVLNEDQQRLLSQGRPIPLDSQPTGMFCGAYSPQGMFVAVLRLDPATGLWRPRKVFL